MVARVAGQRLGVVVDALGEGGQAGHVEEIALNRWSFVHALVGEALYEAVPPTERKRMHRSVAEALEELHPDAVAEIAHHRVEAVLEEVDVDAAVSACERAASAAASVLAFEEAETWYLRALQVLDMGGGRRPAALRAPVLPRRGPRAGWVTGGGPGGVPPSPRGGAPGRFA
ncbi:MAG: hypothetical protein ACRD12_21185 [Acidimicrobiales bacterium]